MSQEGVMHMVQMREMKRSDGEAVIEVHRESIRGLCRTVYSQDQISIWSTRLTREMFDAGIADKSNIGIVATEDDKLIGYGFMNIAEREIKGMYVIPEFSGRGIGRMILSKLEEHAKSNGINTIKLNSTLNAVPFYERCGFKRIRDEFQALTEDCRIECVHMTKEL
jgi:GNAT superfamily N-acetyltransferase